MYLFMHIHALFLFNHLYELDSIINHGFDEKPDSPFLTVTYNQGKKYWKLLLTYGRNFGYG